MTRPRIRGYQDLVVWQRGVALAEAAYALSRRLPRDERYGLALQMQKAAVSIPANIAEGHGREHLGDYLRFLSIANGSLMELETHVVISERLGYITTEQVRTLLMSTAEVGRLLAGLIRALKQRGKPDHKLVAT
jgi:four helix bundle protein